MDFSETYRINSSLEIEPEIKAVLGNVIKSWDCQLEKKAVALQSILPPSSLVENPALLKDVLLCPGELCMGV